MAARKKTGKVGVEGPQGPGQGHADTGQPDRERAADLARRHGRHREGAEGRSRRIPGCGGRGLQAADALAARTREQVIRDAFETAQDTVQTRFGSARDQATETWDNLEALFQSRVHKAMQQLGVPSADEIRLLTRRVAELNDDVKALSAAQARARRAPRKAPPARAKRKTATRKTRTALTAHTRGLSHARPPARRTTTRDQSLHRRFGLALAGGGPLGAFYEVGTLHAIGESFRRPRPDQPRHVRGRQLRAR